MNVLLFVVFGHLLVFHMFHMLRMHNCHIVPLPGITCSWCLYVVCPACLSISPVLHKTLMAFALSNHNEGDLMMELSSSDAERQEKAVQKADRLMSTWEDSDPCRTRLNRTVINSTPSLHPTAQKHPSVIIISHFYIMFNLLSIILLEGGKQRINSVTIEVQNHEQK